MEIGDRARCLEGAVAQKRIRVGDGYCPRHGATEIDVPDLLQARAFAQDIAGRYSEIFAGLNFQSQAGLLNIGLAIMCRK